MDTKGWDAVFVCSVTRINTQLANNMRNLVTTFDLVKDNVHISGTFGAWQVTYGGSGKLLHFETPVSSGTLRITMNDGKVVTQDLTGIKPVLEMQLIFIDNVSVSNVMDLKFNCTVKGQAQGDPKPGAVTTVNPDSSGKITNSNPDTAEFWGILNTYLPDLFIANQDKLAYIFAQINLAPPASSSWLAPKKIAYEYVSPTSGNTGFLAVLTLKQDRTVGSTIEIDTTLLDTNHEVFLLISEALFLQNVLQPMLPGAYGNGANSSNFVYQPLTPTSGQIVNNGSLSCHSVRVGAIDYDPKIDSLNIKIENDTVLTSVNGQCDIKGLLNAYITFSVTSHNKFQYNASNNTITFLPDPNPSSDSDKHIPWYDYAFAGIAGLIITAVVDAVIALVSRSIASSVTGAVASGGQNSLSQAAPAVVAWNGLEHIKVQDCGLQQAFFIRGSYQ